MVLSTPAARSLAFVNVHVFTQRAAYGEAFPTDVAQVLACVRLHVDFQRSTFVKPFVAEGASMRGGSRVDHHESSECPSVETLSHRRCTETASPMCGFSCGPSCTA